jgi:hypothetical protein
VTTNAGEEPFTALGSAGLEPRFEIERSINPRDIIRFTHSRDALGMV